MKINIIKISYNTHDILKDVITVEPLYYTAFIYYSLSYIYFNKIKYFNMLMINQLNYLNINIYPFILIRILFISPLYHIMMPQCLLYQSLILFKVF